MDPLVRRQVERIHSGPTRAVVAVAGGGAQLLSWLLAVPGASRTVLDIQVPYSPTALTEFLGSTPEQAVSQATANEMARVSHERARRLGQKAKHLAGIGCTSAISTDRPRRGKHQCYVAAWTDDGIKTYAVTLIKGARGREAEDEVVSKLALRALSEACGIDPNMASGLEKGETVDVSTFPHDGADPIDRLLAGAARTVVVRPDGVAVADEPMVGAVLSGSFDPLHVGHERLAKVAALLLGSEITYELSIANVDKPSLDQAEVRKRLSQFVGKAPVALTRAATFQEKCALFPGCTFVIGWDTAARLVDIRYYGGDEAAMLSALELMGQRNCRFLVAGRLDEKVFRTLEDVPVPTRFKTMFHAIPESSFRADLSSTELRAAQR